MHVKRRDRTRSVAHVVDGQPKATGSAHAGRTAVLFIVELPPPRETMSCETRWGSFLSAAHSLERRTNGSTRRSPARLASVETARHGVFSRCGTLNIVALHKDGGRTPVAQFGGGRRRCDVNLFYGSAQVQRSHLPMQGGARDVPCAGIQESRRAESSRQRLANAQLSQGRLVDPARLAAIGQVAVDYHRWHRLDAILLGLLLCSWVVAHVMDLHVAAGATRCAAPT